MTRLPAAALLIASFALVSCREKSVEEVETTAAVPVTVEVAKVETLQATISVSGTIVPAAGAELTVVAPAPARIAELPKGEGDAVKKGDLLVRFDIPSLGADVDAKRAAVAQAQARLDASRSNYTRLSSLLAQQVAAQREVEDARRQQAEAEADVEQARSAVTAATMLAERAIVRAPFAGVIAKRLHNPGDLVDASASDPVLKIINPAELQIVAAVPVGDLSRIVTGHTAQVIVPGSETGEAARVSTRPAQVDPASSTADVRLVFAKPTRLAAGMTVQVDILAEERPNALVIPPAAVVTDEGETFVMVAGDDNKAHRYPVALGLMTRNGAEVRTGIKAGDRVIVRGQDELPEGAAITIQK